LVPDAWQKIYKSEPDNQPERKKPPQVHCSAKNWIIIMIMIIIVIIVVVVSVQKGKKLQTVVEKNDYIYWILMK
jgi:hypothetical protein